MIRIYDSAETNFSRNGLADISNVLTRANSNNLLNDLYSAQFDAVYDKWGKWKHIKEGNIIFVDGQPFRIHKTQKILRGFTVFCRHAFWDLLTNEVRDVRPTNTNGMSTLQGIMGATTDPHPFTVFSDITATNTQYYINRNPVDCILGEDSFRTRWGGDLRLNVWEIGMVGHLGQDNGVRIEYRKNMKDVEVTEDRDGLITKMRPKGKDGLELPEIYVNSPYIGNYHKPFISEVEFSDIGVDETTTEAQAIAQLRAAANQYFIDRKCDIPKTNIKVDMILLENTVEYKSFQNLVRVNLGDTVTCRHLDLGIDHKARVIRIEKDLLTGKAAVIEIGDFKRNINSAFTKITNTIKDMSALIANNKTSLQEAIDHATELLTSALGGYVVKRAGEMLIMDTQDPATAVKLWRWNLNGLGYSNTGINGPYGIAMTMDGRINASFITTGVLDAGIVKTGILKSVGNESWLNLADGTFNFADKLKFDGTYFEIDLEVGGRNLLPSTKEEMDFRDLSGLPYWDTGYDIALVAGQEYTFGWKAVDNNAGWNTEIRIGLGTAPGLYSYNLVTARLNVLDDKMYITFTPTAEDIAGHPYFAFRTYNNYLTSKFYMGSLMLETGNKKSAWVPAIDELKGINYKFGPDGFEMKDSNGAVLLTPNGFPAEDNFGRVDNVEPSYPLMLPFNIGANTSSITEVLLKWTNYPFRTYSKGAESGGASEKTSGSSSSSTSGASSKTTSDPFDAGSSLTNIQTMSGTDHYHVIGGSAFDHYHGMNHTHGMAHTHVVSIDPHTHLPVFGILETPMISNWIDVWIDGVYRTSVNAVQGILDITAWVTTPGWHEIHMGVSAGHGLRRVDANVFMKSYKRR